MCNIMISFIYFIHGVTKITVQRKLVEVPGCISISVLKICHLPESLDSHPSKTLLSLKNNLCMIFSIFCLFYFSLDLMVI